VANREAECALDTYVVVHGSVALSAMERALGAGPLDDVHPSTMISNDRHMQPIQVKIPKPLAKRLKIYAVQKGITMTEVVMDGILRVLQGERA
jgi:hypothetical protein